MDEAACVGPEAAFEEEDIACVEVLVGVALRDECVSGVKIVGVLAEGGVIDERGVEPLGGGSSVGADEAREHGVDVKLLAVIAARELKLKGEGGQLAQLGEGVAEGGEIVMEPLLSGG